MSRAKHISKRVAKYALMGLLAYSSAANKAYRYSTRNVEDSSMRQAFEQEFGFPIKGLPEDVEGNPERVSSIASVVRDEMAESPVEINSIRIVSGSYLKNPPYIQLVKRIKHGYMMFTDPFLDSIIIENKAAISETNYRHEIKHAKTFTISKNKPQFRKEWENLATDKNGNTLYLDSWGILSWFGYLNQEGESNSEENQKLGFISELSRTNFYEDVAYLTEGAWPNINSSSILIRLHDSSNFIIKNKIVLAQDYGLIPGEFSEFVALMAQKNAWNRLNFSDKEKKSEAKRFLDGSNAFINGHSGSVYENSLRMVRGDIYRIHAFREKNNVENYCKKGINEYRKVLSLPQKGTLYRDALFNIKDCYEKLNDTSTAAIYEKAHAEYIRRFDSGDITVLRNGMNDFLRENGIEIGEIKR